MSDADPITAAYEEHEATSSDADKVAEIVTAIVSVAPGWGVEAPALEGLYREQIAKCHAASAVAARVDGRPYTEEEMKTIGHGHSACQLLRAAAEAQGISVEPWPRDKTRGGLGVIVYRAAMSDPAHVARVVSAAPALGVAVRTDDPPPPTRGASVRFDGPPPTPEERRSGVLTSRASTTPPRRSPNDPEPAPKPGGDEVWPIVVSDMLERHEHGKAKYGQPLQTFDGRSSLTDAYQEQLDGAVYLRKAIIEFAAAQEACRKLSAALGDLSDAAPAWVGRVTDALRDMRRALALPSLSVGQGDEPRPEDDALALDDFATRGLREGVASAPEPKATGVEASVVRDLLSLMEADDISGGPAIRADLMGLVDGLRQRLGMRGRAHVSDEPESTPMARVAHWLDSAGTLLWMEAARINTNPNGMPANMALERAAGAVKLASADLAAYRATDPSA